jgi:nucleotide-binding universal stress UspA family protein
VPKGLPSGVAPWCHDIAADPAAHDLANALGDIANSKGCDLIVMASHGRCGISALVLGSETVKVTHSSVPVMVFRGQHSALVPDFFAAS